LIRQWADKGLRFNPPVGGQGLRFEVQSLRFTQLGTWKYSKFKIQSSKFKD
jgi:hypothetical protein